MRPCWITASSTISGSSRGRRSAVAEIAARLKRSPGQVALSWLLRRSRVMLPIPGTANPKHLEENVAAAADHLSDADFKALDAQGRKAWESAQQQAA